MNLFKAAILCLCIVSQSYGQEKNSAVEEKSITVKDEVFSLTYPAGWQFSLIQPDTSLPAVVILEVPEKHQKLTLNLLPARNEQMQTQASLEKVLENMGRRFASGSEEKATKPIKLDSDAGPGVYAVFTDSSLVGKNTSGGEYKVATILLMSLGNVVVTADLMSDESESVDFKAAINVLKTGLVLDKSKPAPPPEPVAWNEAFVVSIPREKWNIRMTVPALREYKGTSQPEQFRFTANGEGGFNASIFVEDAAGKPATHEACYESIWADLSKVPILDGDSVKVTKHKDFVEVAYELKVKDERMPHRNFFFAFEGKWVDVHVSVFPKTKQAEEELAKFGNNLKYSMLPVE